MNLRELVEIAKKATKGPWWANRPEDSNGYVHVLAENRFQVCTCYLEPISDCDAAFIARTPDVLSTAVKLAEMLDDTRQRLIHFGPGADLEADVDDPSPDDAVAHDAGLLVQDIETLLTDIHWIEKEE